MKKATLYLMIFLVSVSIFPTSATATEKNSNSISNSPKEIPAEVQVMLNRLNEIKAMDKSNMNRLERKALRKEVRAINTNLRSTGNGVYLSVGALLIIIILLIILL
ncbi:hypothetical protein ACFQZF_10275 [Flavobacterium myungsuense]|uniref:Seryl-tRNA synthetase n=1 Tax=Flavobacterium myungsuense TaxID=651823 RepID=A0ABW3J440_9FLAO